MKITQCRNATVIVTYGDVRFLIDPAFARKGTYPPFPSRERSDEKNPLTDLPFSIRQMTDVDAVIITHLHPDHFDKEAASLLPKELPVFVQNEADRTAVLSAGFTNVEVLSEDTCFRCVCLSKTVGRHGYDEKTVRKFGDVSGVVMRHTGEETLYISGDTVWCREVENVIRTYMPGVIVLNAGANSNLDTQLIMGKEDVKSVHLAAPKARIFATHMEAYNHWKLSRKELTAYAKENGFAELLSVPADGESVTFL